MTQPVTAIHPPPKATTYPDRGCGVLLNENFETATLPPGWDTCADVGVADMLRGGRWYRLASAEYVSWLTLQTRRRLAGMARPDAATLQDELRANFERACVQCPLMRLWAKHRVAIPAGYLPPGHTTGRTLPNGVVVGGPYPDRLYRLEDLGEQELQFLGRNNPAIQARFPRLFPPPPVVVKVRRGRRTRS